MTEEEEIDIPSPDVPDFDVDVPDIPEPTEAQTKTVDDTIETAFKFAFAGVGQAGGRLAEMFQQLGYRRIAAVNTATQDLAPLKLEQSQKMKLGEEEGAGKDPEVAASLAKEHREDILDHLRKCFGDQFDRTIVCASAGGGTGAGAVTEVARIAKDLQNQLKCKHEKVGIILALPKLSEGTTPALNAHRTLQKCLGLVDEGVVSPLIILDNERISKIYPNLPVTKSLSTANSSVCQLFNLFNSLACKPSTFQSFDANDYKSVLDSGIVVLGATRVAEPEDQQKVSGAIRNNLKKTILSDGCDISTGKIAAAVVVAGRDVLDTVPQENLDHAFSQLNRILDGATVHQGIYVGSKPNMLVYTAIGGIAHPESKLDDLTKAAGVFTSTRRTEA